MAVTDLNGDGRPDLAYYGEPKELVVLYNEGTNTWSTPKRWPIEDGQLTPNAMTADDLNGDGRRDLDVHLVRLELDQRLAGHDGVAFLLQPLGDARIHDRLADFGNDNVG